MFWLLIISLWLHIYIDLDSLDSLTQDIQMTLMKLQMLVSEKVIDFMYLEVHLTNVAIQKFADNYD